MAQPPFCSSAPMLTWMKQGTCRPALSIALASAVTSEGRSSEWMQSNSAPRRPPCSTGAGRQDAATRPSCGFEQRGPLGLCFLHPVLAKHALPRRDQGRDGIGGVGLGNGDQFDVGRLAPGDRRGLGDPFADIVQGLGWLGHGALL
jgi:hypothetical protein